MSKITGWFWNLRRPIRWIVALMTLVVLLVLQIGLAVPVSPGGLGVFEYLSVLALSLFTVPRREAVAFGVGQFHFDPEAAVFVVVVVGLITTMSAWFGARQALNQRPIDNLRGTE